MQSKALLIVKAPPGGAHDLGSVSYMLKINSVKDGQQVCGSERETREKGNEQNMETANIRNETCSAFES